MILQPVNLNFNYCGVNKLKNNKISPVIDNTSKPLKNIDYRNYPLSFNGLFANYSSAISFTGMDKDKVTIERYLDCHIGGNLKGVSSNTSNPVQNFVDINLYEFANNLDYLIRVNLHYKKMSFEEIVNIFDKYSNINEGEIDKKIASSLDDGDSKYNAKEIISRRQKFLKDLVKYMNENEEKLKQEEWVSLYYDVGTEIINNIYKDEQNKFEEYNESIRKKLEYGESNPKPINIKEEIAKLPSNLQDEINKKYGGNYEKMMRQYVAQRAFQTYVAKPEYGVNVEEALLQMLPRYEAEKPKNNSSDSCFEYQPLYRWLNVGNVNEFLKQFEPGSIYSYDKSQSCAKSSYGAESWYGDSHIHQNVKFRIHPKSQLTQSYDIKDIECNKETDYEYMDDLLPVYRTSETIYPANQKFKVLGYTKVLSDYPENHLSGTSEKDKIIIDLQEM